MEEDNTETVTRKQTDRRVLLLLSRATSITLPEFAAQLSSILHVTSKSNLLHIPFFFV